MPTHTRTHTHARTHTQWDTQWNVQKKYVIFHHKAHWGACKGAGAVIRWGRKIAYAHAGVIWWVCLCLHFVCACVCAYVNVFVCQRHMFFLQSHNVYTTELFTRIPAKAQLKLKQIWAKTKSAFDVCALRQRQWKVVTKWERERVWESGKKKHLAEWKKESAWLCAVTKTVHFPRCSNGFSGQISTKQKNQEKKKAKIF